MTPTAKGETLQNVEGLERSPVIIIWNEWADPSPSTAHALPIDTEQIQLHI